MGAALPTVPAIAPLTPRSRAVVVTPSNTAHLTATVNNDSLTEQNIITRALHVGGAGIVYVDMASNNGLADAAGTVLGATATGTLVATNASGTVGETIGGTLVTVSASDTDDALTATALAAAIDLNVTLGPLVNAAAVAKVVTITATVAGPAQNYTLVASGTGVTASGATLTGGVLATGDVIFGGGGGGQVGAVINGTTVTVAWNVNPTTTGDDFVTALELNGVVGGAFSSAANVAGTVTITITNPVAAAVANAYTLVASGTDVSVSGATFGVGGAAVLAVDATGTLTLANATGTVGGTIDGTLVTVTASDVDDALTMADLANTINANTTVNKRVSAVAAGDTITLTAAIAGKFGNAVTTVASGTGMAANAATLTGGTGGSGNYVPRTCVAGQVLDINVIRVYILGTTATLMVAEF